MLGVCSPANTTAPKRPETWAARTSLRQRGEFQPTALAGMRRFVSAGEGTIAEVVPHKRKPPGCAG